MRMSSRRNGGDAERRLCLVVLPTPRRGTTPSGGPRRPASPDASHPEATRSGVSPHRRPRPRRRRDRPLAAPRRTASASNDPAGEAAPRGARVSCDAPRASTRARGPLPRREPLLLRELEWGLPSPAFVRTAAASAKRSPSPLPGGTRPFARTPRETRPSDTRPRRSAARGGPLGEGRQDSIGRLEVTHRGFKQSYKRATNREIQGVRARDSDGGDGTDPTAGTKASRQRSKY